MKQNTQFHVEMRDGLLASCISKATEREKEHSCMQSALINLHCFSVSVCEHCALHSNQVQDREGESTPESI